MALVSSTSLALLNASAAPIMLNTLDTLISSTIIPSTLNGTNATNTAGNIHEFTSSETAIMTIAMVALILITLFGNLLVLGIFYQYMPLRTVTNYFIVSLANADLLVAVLSIPIWIAYIQVSLAELTFGAEVRPCLHLFLYFYQAGESEKETPFERLLFRQYQRKHILQYLIEQATCAIIFRLFSG